jgi:hypothetical protein
MTTTTFTAWSWALLSSPLVLVVLGMGLAALVLGEE